MEEITTTKFRVPPKSPEDPEVYLTLLCFEVAESLVHVQTPD